MQYITVDVEGETGSAARLYVNPYKIVWLTGHKRFDTRCVFKTEDGSEWIALESAEDFRDRLELLTCCSAPADAARIRARKQ